MVCVGWVGGLEALICHELGVEMVCVGWDGGLSTLLLLPHAGTFAQDIRAGNSLHHRAHNPERCNPKRSQKTISSSRRRREGSKGDLEKGKP